MSDIRVWDDLGAITLSPADGGEAWVEPYEDGFQIGVEDPEHRCNPEVAYVQVTRDELRAFRKVIDDALGEES